MKNILLTVLMTVMFISGLKAQFIPIRGDSVYVGVEFAPRGITLKTAKGDLQDVQVLKADLLGYDYAVILPNRSVVILTVVYRVTGDAKEVRIRWTDLLVK